MDFFKIYDIVIFSSASHVITLLISSSEKQKEDYCPCTTPWVLWVVLITAAIFLSNPKPVIWGFIQNRWYLMGCCLVFGFLHVPFWKYNYQFTHEFFWDYNLCDIRMFQKQFFSKPPKKVIRTSLANGSWGIDKT